jgi:hypothetical protein
MSPSSGGYYEHEPLRVDATTAASRPSWSRLYMLQEQQELVLVGLLLTRVA